MAEVLSETDLNGSLTFFVETDAIVLSHPFGRAGTGKARQNGTRGTFYYESCNAKSQIVFLSLRPHFLDASKQLKNAVTQIAGQSFGHCFLQNITCECPENLSIVDIYFTTLLLPCRRN